MFLARERDILTAEAARQLQLEDAEAPPCAYDFFLKSLYSKFH